MTKNNFISKVFSELLDDNFSILIHQKKAVNNCGGWFSPSDREFTVAMKNRMGYEILIHEYSHYLQWKTKKRYFNKLSKSCDIVFSWIDGTFYKKDILDAAFRDVIELEWDCETIALDLIRKYKLDVDVDEYLRASNAYLMFYHIVRKHRKWCKKSPYNVKMTKLMPPMLHPLEYYFNIDNITEKQDKEYLKVL